MIDLHSHTTASDGSLSPAQLLDYAAQKGLEVLAITDHDTVAGLAEGAAAAERLGITFVPGIEISMAWPQGEFHLLGLGIRQVSPEMQELVQAQQEERLRRNLSIIAKMNADGIPVTLDDIARSADGSPVRGSIGRPHFADYLLRSGRVRTRQQAFDLYLGHGRPYYEAQAGADWDRAIAAVLSCGALPVVAHPLSLYLGRAALEAQLAEFKERGVAGLEAWHPAARPGECIRLEELARKLGLFVTAGSDFHGPGVRADRRLGHTAGLRRIDRRFYDEELLPRLG